MSLWGDTMPADPLTERPEARDFETADTEPAALFCDACVYCGEACPATEEYCSVACEDEHREEMNRARSIEQGVDRDVEDATCADPRFDSDRFASAALDETAEHKAVGT